MYLLSPAHAAGDWMNDRSCAGIVPMFLNDFERSKVAVWTSMFESHHNDYYILDHPTNYDPGEATFYIYDQPVLDASTGALKVCLWTMLCALHRVQSMAKSR